MTHAWERGSRKPSASDFFKLARLSGVDVGRVLSEFAAGHKVSSTRSAFDARSTAAWLRALARGRSQAELSHAVRRDRNTVARWLSGDTEPRLPDLLRFVDSTTQRMLDFVAAFVDPRSLASLCAMWKDLDLQRRLAYEMPWAHAVLRALELGDYARQPEHVPGFIATHIGISLELEEACLKALARAGQIRRRRGKWRPSRVLSVDTQDNPEANLRLKRHWAQVAVERIEQAGLPRGSQYSYNLFAISQQGLEEIRQAHLQYYERVRSIVAACQQPTQLALINVQLLPLYAE